MKRRSKVICEYENSRITVCSLMIISHRKPEGRAIQKEHHNKLSTGEVDGTTNSRCKAFDYRDCTSPSESNFDYLLIYDEHPGTSGLAWYRIAQVEYSSLPNAAHIASLRKATAGATINTKTSVRLTITILSEQYLIAVLLLSAPRGYHGCHRILDWLQYQSPRQRPRGDRNRLPEARAGRVTL